MRIQNKQKTNTSPLTTSFASSHAPASALTCKHLSWTPWLQSFPQRSAPHLWISTTETDRPLALLWSCVPRGQRRLLSKNNSSRRRSHSTAPVVSWGSWPVQTTANKALSLVTEGPAHLLSDASCLFIFFAMLRGSCRLYEVQSFDMITWRPFNLSNYCDEVCKVWSIANTIHFSKPSYEIRRGTALVQVPKYLLAHILSIILIWLEKVT